MRTVHPPTCPHASCNEKTFTTQKGLRAHMKIHEQLDIEVGLCDPQADDADGEVNDDDEPPQKKRRGGQVGRDFVCECNGCGKDFKSVSYLGPCSVFMSGSFT